VVLETGEVYVQWITADPVAKTSQGCNISQIENFHQVWVAHSPPAIGVSVATVTTVWDAHLVFDGNIGRTWQTNTDRIFATLAVDDSGVSGVAVHLYSLFPYNLVSLCAIDLSFTDSYNEAQSAAPPIDVNRAT